jgi:predicted negative regulator of RcsB-dependent stress response
MLITFLISAVLLGVLLVIGFYLGWFNLDPGRTESFANSTLSLNDTNIKTDEDKTKDTNASANKSSNV